MTPLIESGRAPIIGGHGFGRNSGASAPNAILAF